MQQDKIKDRKTLNDGAVVFREGELASQAYLVAQGEVILSKIKGQNQEEIIHCQSGEFIGVNAMLPGKKYSATARVKGGATIVPISSEMLNAQFSKLDKLGQNVVTCVLERLDASLQELTDD